MTILCQICEVFAHTDSRQSAKIFRLYGMHVIALMHIHMHIHTHASEYRSWLLFYSVPVLQGIMNKLYLNHYILLVEAAWLLLQSKMKTLVMPISSFSSNLKRYVLEVIE